MLFLASICPENTSFLHLITKKKHNIEIIALLNAILHIQTLNPVQLLGQSKRIPIITWEAKAERGKHPVRDA